MRDGIASFLKPYKLEIRDVVFECDGDCEKFAKHVGLNYSHSEGEAYVISDIVAWLNNRGKEPPGTISNDLRNQLEKNL